MLPIFTVMGFVAKTIAHEITINSFLKKEVTIHNFEKILLFVWSVARLAIATPNAFPLCFLFSFSLFNKIGRIYR